MYLHTFLQQAWFVKSHLVGDVARLVLERDRDLPPDRDRDRLERPGAMQLEEEAVTGNTSAPPAACMTSSGSVVGSSDSMDSSS